MTGDDENSLPYRLFLTDRQVITPHKVFANKSSASIKLKTTQLPKIMESGQILDRLLGILTKVGLPFMKKCTPVVSQEYVDNNRVNSSNNNRKSP